MIKNIKIMAVMLSVFVSLGATAANYFYFIPVEVDGFKYEIDYKIYNVGIKPTIAVSANLTGAPETVRDVTVPKEIKVHLAPTDEFKYVKEDDYVCTVKDIATEAFYGHDMLETLVATDVEGIYNSAFLGLKNLKRVELGGQVRLSDDAFAECPSLSVVIIHNNKDVALNIVTEAFRDCKSLRRVVLPDNLNILNSNAFKGCDSFDDIDIDDPFSEKKLTYQYGAISKGDIFIIYPNARKGSIIRGTAIFGSGKYIKVSDYLNDCMFSDEYRDIPTGSLSNCTNLDSVTILQRASVREYAFKGASIKYLELPQETSVNGKDLFEGCNNLAHIKMWDKSVNWIKPSLVGLS